MEITKDVLDKLNNSKFANLVTFDRQTRIKLGLSDDVIRRIPEENYVAIDFSKLENELKPEDIQELNEILSMLQVTNIRLESIGENVDIGLFSKIDKIDMLILERKENFPKIDISKISEFKQIKTLSIIGQSIDDEEFENFADLGELEGIICQSDTIDEKGVQYLISLPKINDLQVLKTLKSVDQSLPEGRFINLNNTLKMPLVTSVQELETIINSGYFLNKAAFPLSYVGTEPIPPELFEKLEGRKIALWVENPLVLDEKFCQNTNSNENLHVYIWNDYYMNYKMSDISAINTKILEIAEGAPKEGSDLDKVAYLYSVIGKNIEYDFRGCKTINDEPNPNWDPVKDETTRSLYGLLDNQSVCYGYALIFQILAKQLGLECNLLVGDMYNEDKKGVGHAWNQIKIDDKWYDLDVTWDSPRLRDGKNVSYFLIDDEKLYESDKLNLRKNVAKKEMLEEFVDKETGKVDLANYWIFRESKNDTENYLNQKYKKAEICNESYSKSESLKALRAFGKEKKSKININGIGKLSEHIKSSELSNKVKEIVEKVKEFFSKDKGDIEKDD